MALSRALGDFAFKNCDTKPAEEQIVTGENNLKLKIKKSSLISAFPDVITDKLTPDHEFIVLACDGIWDVMTNQEVVDFVREKLAEKRDPQSVS